MRIRQSDLNSFQRCGMQKHLRDQKKATGEKEGDNLSATVFGTVMHHATQVMETLHHEGREDALDTAKATFAHYWMPDNLPNLPGCEGGIDVWLPKQTYGGLRERGLHTLRDYYEVLCKDTGRLLALEQYFEVPHVIPGDPEEHVLTGTADRLSLRVFGPRKRPYLSIDDFKSGKKPSRLRYAVQWSMYGKASLHPEFWRPFGDAITPIVEALHKKKLALWDDGSGLPIIARRGRWISLTEGAQLSDAGWRGPHDYARLDVALREYVKAQRADVHPLTLSGEVCEYCPFARNGDCGGVPIPEIEDGAPT